MSTQDTLLAGLSPEEKRNLLRELLQKKAREATSTHPLSYGQQALWFIYQLARESPAYNMAFSARIYSDINVEAMRRSFQAVVDRHPLLRATFAFRSGTPLLQVAGYQDVRFERIDISDLSEDELEQRVLHEYRIPFDLENGPLLRVTLFTRAKAEHILLIMAHHIVFDGWSMSLVLDEFRTFYESEVTGKQIKLAGPSGEYSDYVKWQRELIAGSESERLRAYWERQLSGSNMVLDLPTDRPCPPVQGHHGASQYIVIEEDLAHKLRAIAKEQAATPYMAFLAAFQILLYRLSGQGDLLVGSPMVGRSRTEFERIVGYFVNPVVIRANLSGNPTFNELLAQVRQTVIDALAHQDYPFSRLVEHLRPERDPSRSPLFQVMFNMLLKGQKYGELVRLLQTGGTQQKVDFGGLTVSPFMLPQQQGQFDLVLALIDSGTAVLGALIYDTDLFDDETIVRWAAYYRILLDSIVAGPNTPIAELTFLPDSERQQLLVDWNATAAEYPHERCVHELIEAQARRTPEVLAVVAEDGRLNYGELNQRANQLARYLKALGVGPEVRVGLCVERSIEIIVGLLGILKAGGAYVPLDPDYPSDRLAFMLRDAEAAVLITQERFVASFPGCQARVVRLDSDWQVIARENEENLASTASPGNLAYVIYTSGSAGRPKGVMVEHRSLAGYVQTASVEFGLESSDRVLQFASVSFDAAAEEIFPCLMRGATLVLRTDAMLGSVPVFLAACNELGVSVLDLPTAYWHQLASELAAEDFALPESLRLVIIGGEKALPERVAAWQRRVGQGVRLVNSYGPTEATIVATMYELTDAGPDEVLQGVPIGKPIRNVQAYILDRYGQPVPIGVPGELYIGGAGVARGYLNRPELTAEKFVPSAWGDGPSGRLYKTGDRARYRPDGNIEFLGRIDHQVKVRGFRIELDEIEKALAEHPDVRQAVVLAREDNPGDRRLVGYVVTGKGYQLPAGDLRNHLKERLPGYMVPSAFVVLEQLPLTPNGKVDLKALPDPDRNRPVTGERYVAPRTPVEGTLARIWAEVLKLERVGIHDNFFEVGGDSILSIQIIARCRQAGLQLKPNDLFKHQTISELAAVARVSSAMQSDQGLVKGSLPLTPIQRSFFEQDLPDRHHWNQALLLQVRNDLNVSFLELAVQELIQQHDALRLRFVRAGSQWSQYYVESHAALPIIQIDLSTVPLAEQQSVFSAESARIQVSLNITEGPLIRVAHFMLGQGQPDHLLIVVHHLVVDGVSWRILIEDLESVYLQLCRGEAVRLPAKTSSFKEWSERLTRHAQSPVLRSELEYWLTVGRGAEAKIPVDFDRRDDNTEGSAMTVTVSLTKEETRKLLREVPAAYNTQINDVLLMAFVQAFAQWSGTQSLLVDLEGHGREDIFEAVDLSRTVGWFTTVFPVRLSLASTSDLGANLKGVKEQLRSIPNRGIGYGLLCYLSGDPEVQRELASLPQAEVAFNYLGQFDQVFSASSLFRFSSEPRDSYRSPRGLRGHLIEVNALVTGEQLRIAWTYSKNLHKEETLRRLAQYFLEALRALISHCLSLGAGGYTPSDFPQARISQKDLDKLLSKFKQTKGPRLS